jgi:hypothetical protein
MFTFTCFHATQVMGLAFDLDQSMAIGPRGQNLTK